MQKRVLIGALSLAITTLWSTPMLAADSGTFKIGLILPMTGQQATTGRQIEANARLYMAQNGDTVAGKKVQLIVKDDGGTPQGAQAAARAALQEGAEIVLGPLFSASVAASTVAATSGSTGPKPGSTIQPTRSWRYGWRPIPTSNWTVLVEKASWPSGPASCEKASAR